MEGGGRREDGGAWRRPVSHRGAEGVTASRLQQLGAGEVVLLAHCADGGGGEAGDGGVGVLLQLLQVNLASHRIA